MKRSSVTLAAILSGILMSCKKPEARRHESHPPALDSESGSELAAEQQRVKAEHDQLAARRNLVEHEIQEMKAQSAELAGNLRLSEAERARMLEEGYYLKRRWEKELEGLLEAPSRPVSELYVELARKTEQLLQENAELKKKLEEAGK